MVGARSAKMVACDVDGIDDGECFEGHMGDHWPSLLGYHHITCQTLDCSNPLSPLPQIIHFLLFFNFGLLVHSNIKYAALYFFIF